MKRHAVNRTIIKEVSLEKITGLIEVYSAQLKARSWADWYAFTRLFGELTVNTCTEFYCIYDNEGEPPSNQPHNASIAAIVGIVNDPFQEVCGIGIAWTDPQCRRQGLMEELVRFLLAQDYEEYEIEVTSPAMLGLMNKIAAADERVTVFENC